MDPRVAGAGVAMALGMMLLLPTFNALNNSYVEDVAPPPWMPMPDEIPENFKPPEDWEPPEGYEPPPDMEPPPGWEPPPGYDGPIPPGGCPPPVVRHVEGMNQTGTIDPSWNGASFTFRIPEYAVAVVANVTFTQWQASSVRAQLGIPGGETMDDEQQGAGGGLLSPAQPTRETAFVFQLVAEDEASMPPQGEYTLTLNAGLPISGNWKTEVVVGLPCGGMLS